MQHLGQIIAPAGYQWRVGSDSYVACDGRPDVLDDYDEDTRGWVPGLDVHDDVGLVLLPVGCLRLLQLQMSDGDLFASSIGWRTSCYELPGGDARGIGR